MSIAELAHWIGEQSKPHITWYVKRLSANDTLASGSHQAGPYFPKELLFNLFPSLNKPAIKNPDKRFELRMDSHKDVREIRAVWYNNRVSGTGTRDEARLTGFGGIQSAVLDPDNTGALAVFAFHRDENGEATVCHAWVCEHETEADLVEERVGPVEPAKYHVWSINSSILTQKNQPCWMEPDDIPPAWRLSFPSGAAIIERTLELRPFHGMPIDTRLIKRRQCEFEIFRSLEENVELPLIRQGFYTIDQFVARAQTILQRRKARSGRSLELHARAIFLEEALREGSDFSHQPESDTGKRPDFLFPNENAYKDILFPADRLRMLAVKTTCKDRWRQILSEAERIKTKHLLTLQEGVSVAQFKEMTESHVQLVVPSPLISAYPSEVQPHLQTLESFIGDVRLLSIR